MGLPLALFGLSLATGGLLAAMPVLWTFPISMFSGAAAATAIATINSIGALGGIIGPSVIGFAAEKTGKPASGLGVVALFMFVAFVISLFLKIHGKEIKETRSTLQKISNVRFMKR
jgi:ACS family tartrate transporter-like MFS transporter